jgi:two-component system cell cycle sensor histidine kinase/response regulator CckA
MPTQASHAEPGRTTRILVVDDEQSVREFVQRVLQDAGYVTTVAGSGAEALRMFSDGGAPDLLLADVNMPGMNGNELAAKLRQQVPDLKVLYLTGFADQLFTERGTLWEGESYLDKPCTVAGLLEAVAMALYGRLQAGASDV